MRLRATSPVAGLRRRSLGPVEVLAQSVAATAPAAAMATSPALAMAPGALAPPVPAFAAATVVVLLVASCIRQFARRMVAPGSLYSFTAKGLGPVPALVGGAALAVGHWFLVAGSLTGAGWCAVALLQRSTGTGGGLVPLAAAVLLGGALVVGSALRGVGPSARLVLALEAVSIAVVGTALVVLLLRSGPPPPVAAVLPGAPPGGGAQGVLLAVTAFVGFESACALGTESRRPFAAVPAAVRRTVLGAGVLYVLSSAAQAALFAGAPAAVGGPMPLVDVALARGGPLLAVAVELGVLASFLGCAAGSLTALVRLLFTAAREGVLPAALGRTGRTGTPATA
ncbi:APC family permease, partial [Kineococcus glutinatus]|uniref:APC family permease n=1 Tax=Kineococcus glutinatus TaxID=1070872 RepID=UPI0031EDCB16